MVAEITALELVMKLERAATGARNGAFRGMQRACLGRQATAMRYCTPGQSPFDPMIFPTKTTGTGAPLDTGVMRASIYYQVEWRGSEIHGGVGAGGGGKNVDGRLVAGTQQGAISLEGYSGYVHDGTSKMAARPFIRRAIEDEQDDTAHELSTGTWIGLVEALR
jgi:HK97 gp10 family phage protein